MLDITEKDLNAEQLQAVNCPDSVILIACPGSGKTRTLTYKIALELSRISSPKSYILAITYTNAAAEEIKERIDRIGVDTSQLWIGTIHSFCLEWIIRPYSLYHEELKMGISIINPHEASDVLTALCAAYKTAHITPYDFSFYATLGGYEVSCPKNHLKSHAQAIFAQYRKYLRKERKMDMEQILHYAYELVKLRPEIVRTFSKIFPFVLVDEFQDTKLIQYHIIFSILKAGTGQSKLLIVGDPNQAIFTSLGGYPMQQDEMEKLLGYKIRHFDLSSNYRSSDKIISYFGEYKTFPNKIVAAGHEKDYPSLITYNDSITHSKLTEHITTVIKYNIDKKGISPDEICVAGPQWFPLAALTRGLIVNLPDLNFDGPGMAPFAKDIDNFWYKVARVLLTQASPDLYLRRLRWASEILRELEAIGIDTGDLTNRHLLRVCNSLNITQTEGLPFLSESFIKLGLLFRWDITRNETLKDHYESFFGSANARIENLRRNGNHHITSLENFRKVFRQKGGIKISTIHGIKGMEFDTIIGFGLLDGWIPYGDDEHGLKSSTKMLYVLCSRARKNLHLISENGRTGWGFPLPEGRPPTPKLSNYIYSYDNYD